MGSHAIKVLINPKSRRAYGIVFVRNGVKQIVYARKEVILSAGAINTPQLLMLSGVGPEEELNKFNIPVIKSLKVYLVTQRRSYTSSRLCNRSMYVQVGENLQDHVGLGGMTFLIDKPVSIVQERFQTVPITTQYIINERGPMTTLGGLEAVAFVNTKYANKSGTYPDIQFHFAPASVNSDAGMSHRLLNRRLKK